MILQHLHIQHLLISHIILLQHVYMQGVARFQKNVGTTVMTLYLEAIHPIQKSEQTECIVLMTILRDFIGFRLGIDNM